MWLFSCLLFVKIKINNLQIEKETKKKTHISGMIICGALKKAPSAIFSVFDHRDTYGKIFSNLFSNSFFLM